MPDRDAIDRLRRGIPLDGHRTLPANVTLVTEHRRDGSGLLRITIREGRNRQIRRMCEAVGHPVTRLVRRFLDACERGGAPSPGFAEGYRVQCLIDAARQTDDSGRWVEVAPDREPRP